MNNDDHYLKPDNKRPADFEHPELPPIDGLPSHRANIFDGCKGSGTCYVVTIILAIAAVALITKLLH